MLNRPRSEYGADWDHPTGAKVPTRGVVVPGPNREHDQTGLRSSPTRGLATMALLGERNWYLPKWMDRLLPHIRFSH